MHYLFLLPKKHNGHVEICVTDLTPRLKELLGIGWVSASHSYDDLCTKPSARRRAHLAKSARSDTGRGSDRFVP